MLTDFYISFSAVCFTLLGLWLVVVQTRHAEWRGSPLHRRRGYGVAMYFSLPGLMSLLALVNPASSALWRTPLLALMQTGEGLKTRYHPVSRLLVVRGHQGFHDRRHLSSRPTASMGWSLSIGPARRPRQPELSGDSALRASPFVRSPPCADTVLNACIHSRRPVAGNCGIAEATAEAYSEVHYRRRITAGHRPTAQEF